MKYFVVLFTLLSLALYSEMSIAQPEDLLIGKIHQINSSILEEPRQIVVYAPEDYQGSHHKYPVLYLLDAEWNFHYVSGLVRQLSAAGAIPEMIVVGLINTNRNRDLTPPGTNDHPDRFGGALTFLQFITEEVQGYVAQNYRVQPYRILAGHSFGGLFSLFAAMENPGAFHGIIALSPSLGRNDEQEVKRAAVFFQSEEIWPESLYLAVGNEGGYTYLSSKKFATILIENTGKKLRWTFRHLAAENHVSITIPGFLEGLQFIFDGINPEKKPELDDIFLMETHYRQLSDRYGYEFLVPEQYYQKFVQEQIAERELEYALFILGKYQEKYPDALGMLLGFADVHLLNANFEEARTYYERLKGIDPDNEKLNALLEQLGK